MAKRKTHLLIIDPQNDFCDLPAAWCPELPRGGRATPALPVPGSHQDLLRVAQLIERAGPAISNISITLDSHQRLDIAHPLFWQTADGGAVNPFTLISLEDVRTGRFTPRLPGSARERALAYLEALERQGRYQHMVWPVHCEIGSWGQNVHAEVRAAYNAWEERCLGSVSKVTKGTNPWTEHYSAIQAEVPDPSDPDTGLNTALVAELKQADLLLIAGEAGSHCVKATTEHLVLQLSPEEARRLVLLTDCMSPVSGFEASFEAFVADMGARGVALKTATQVEQDLREMANAGIR